jgi:hypothetical protein
MRKLFWLIPLMAAASWGAQADCFVGAGTPENTFAEGDCYVTGDTEVDGVLLLDAIAIPVDDVTPDVSGGNIAVTGINTVPTAITDLDNPIPGAEYTIICGDIANASTIADAGNFTLEGAWNPVAIGDSIKLYCRADNDYIEVSRTFIAGGEGRGDYITYIDTFDVGNDADLAVRWDVTNVVGAGTNDETTLDGWNRLITGGAGGPDMESTRSNGLNHYRAYAPRIECVVDLAAVAAGQNFYFGFWAAGNEFAEIIHEPATSANWLLRVDDTAGADTVDSGVAATTDPTKLELAVTAAGVVSWAIDDVAMTVVGMTNNMTANAHYVEWRLLDVAAAAHTADVDYFMSEQLRQQ